MKLLFLVLNRSETEWKMPPREWAMAKAQFAVMFGERFIRAMAGCCSTRPPHTEFLTVPASAPRSHSHSEVTLDQPACQNGLLLARDFLDGSQRPHACERYRLEDRFV